MPRTRVRLALHAADAKRRREARTGWRPQRDRACVVSGTCRETVYPSFRHDASTTVRFPSRAPDSTHRAAPRARRLRMTRESVFESSRDSGFSDETTTVRGHEGHDVREDEKNEFSLKNITETLRTSPTRSRGATARGTPTARPASALMEITRPVGDAEAAPPHCAPLRDFEFEYLLPSIHAVRVPKLTIAELSSLVMVSGVTRS